MRDSLTGDLDDCQHLATAQERGPALSEQPVAANLAQLHVNAGLLIERYLQDSDPCVAVWLSRQFRLISENPAMPDADLRVLYRTLAARWHQMATQMLCDTRPQSPWLDEFPEESAA